MAEVMSTLPTGALEPPSSISIGKQVAISESAVLGLGLGRLNTRGTPLSHSLPLYPHLVKMNVL